MTKDFKKLLDIEALIYENKDVLDVLAGYCEYCVQEGEDAGKIYFLVQEICRINNEIIAKFDCA